MNGLNFLRLVDSEVQLQTQCLACSASDYYMKWNSLQGLEPTNTSLWVFCLRNLLDPFLMLSEAGYWVFSFWAFLEVFGVVQCQTLFVTDSEYPAAWSSQQFTAYAPSAGAGWVWKGWSCLLLLALGPRAGQARLKALRDPLLPAGWQLISII